MAAVISDFMSDSAHFHHTHPIIAATSQQSSSADPQYLQPARSRAEVPPSPRPQPTSSPTVVTRVAHQEPDSWRKRSVLEPPSPPPSSSPIPTSTRQRFTSQEHFPQSSASGSRALQQDALKDSRCKTKTATNSPSSKPYASMSRPTRSLDDVVRHGGNTIKVRDLAHIQSFATEEFLSFRGYPGQRRTTDDTTLKYEISGMPISDIIEMVAGLLTKITTTNDRQHENSHRATSSGDSTVSLTGLSSSVLAFHGKNVPSISILSYLSRIHKYCPTTYEVFLSLLVYFDRMTERVNAPSMQCLGKDTMELETSPPSSGYSTEGSDLFDSPLSSRSVPEIQTDLQKAQYTHIPAAEKRPEFPLSHYFVVDSFNIHRLVIAGVTCASKFFSDIFYTNSRYAKVGGLPLAELNHLELQFLLLNDFRLSVPVEELEAYGTMLVEFYAREVIAQRPETIPANTSYQYDTDT